MDWKVFTFREPWQRAPLGRFGRRVGLGRLNYPANRNNLYVGTDLMYSNAAGRIRQHTRTIVHQNKLHFTDVHLVSADHHSLHIQSGARMSIPL